MPLLINLDARVVMTVKLDACAKCVAQQTSATGIINFVFQFQFKIHQKALANNLKGDLAGFNEAAASPVKSVRII